MISPDSGLILLLVFEEFLFKDSVDTLSYAVVAGIVAFRHADWHLAAVQD